MLEAINKGMLDGFKYDLGHKDDNIFNKKRGNYRELSSLKN